MPLFLEFFSQIHHKSKMAGVAGAACPAKRSINDVLKPAASKADLSKRRKLQKRVDDALKIQDTKKQLDKGNRDRKFESFNVDGNDALSKQAWSSIPPPESVCAPPWPYAGDVKQYTLQVLNVTVITKSLKSSCNEDFLEKHLVELPADEQRPLNIKPDPAVDRNDYQRLLQDYKRGPKPESASATVVRLSCLAENGCPILVNVYGHTSDFFVPVPKELVADLMQATFGVNEIYQQWTPEVRQAHQDKLDDKNNVKVRQACDVLRRALEVELQVNGAKQLQKVSGDFHYAMIHEVRIVVRETLWYYNFDQQLLFFEIRCVTESVKREVMKILGNGLHIPPGAGAWRYFAIEDTEFYNAKVPPETSYLVRTDQTGFSWFSIDRDKCEVKGGYLPAEQRRIKEGVGEYKDSFADCDTKRASPDVHRESYHRREIDVSVGDMVNLKGLDKVAVYRLLSVDIECAPQGTKFPTFDQNEVIMIAVVLRDSNDTPLSSVEMTYKTAPPKSKPDSTDHNDITSIGDGKVEVWMYEDEQDMLKGYAEYLRSVTPQIILQYNGEFFDIPYLLQRAELLLIPTFPLWSGVKEALIWEDSIYKTRAAGEQRRRSFRMVSGFIYDVCRMARSELKLSSYTLGSVAEEIVGQTKNSMPYTIITRLFYGTRQERERVLLYCDKDAQLVLDIMFKLQVLTRAVGMCRITGATIHHLYAKGQGNKIINQILRVTNRAGYLLPNRKKLHPDLMSVNLTTMSTWEINEMYETIEKSFPGATVLEPISGFYADPSTKPADCKGSNEHYGPVATLDYASLYPSEIEAHNLCYTTIIRPGDEMKMNPSDFTEVDCGDIGLFRYVKRHIKQGIVPRCCAALILARSFDKDKIEKDGALGLDTSLTEASSLAKKLCTNSLFGFFASDDLHLPGVGASICNLGRKSLQFAKTTVEECFKAYDAKVIAGDTDSVMINFPGLTIEKAHKLALEAELIINRQLISPQRIEFEKIFSTFWLPPLRKVYCGLQLRVVRVAEGDPDPGPECFDRSKGKLNSKGMKKRDKNPFSKRVVNEIIQRVIVRGHSKAEVLEYVYREILSLCQGKLSMAEVINSKSVKEHYAATCPQQVVADKMRARDPGTAPRAGDRVAYVPVVIFDKKRQSKSSQMENPLYVIENDLLVDYRTVGDSGIIQDLRRLLEVIEPDEKVLKHVFSPFERLHPPPVPSKGPLDSMFTAVRKCESRNCRATLRMSSLPTPGARVLCNDHRGQIEEIIQVRRDQVEATKAKHKVVWDKCRVCDETSYLDCNYCDCANLYRRKEVDKLLAHQERQFFDASSLDW